MLVDPVVADVVTARDRQPDGDVVVLLVRRSPAGTAVAVLEAGASACVRDPDVTLVLSYLQRLHRTHTG